MRPTIVAVTGPTATGKTDLAVALAQYFKTSVVNCDSRQFYREMTIGTAKPSAHQLETVPHCFVNFLSISETFTAGDFEKEALKEVELLSKESKILIACGGSGLFVKALCEGLGDAPEVNLEIRAKWQSILSEKGITFLQNEIMKRDPEWYAAADKNNPRRLQRALEIMDTTGSTVTVHQQRTSAERFFDVLYVGLKDRKRETLYNRINKRVDNMIEAGLMDEVAGLLKYKEYPAFNTIGYKEWLPFFENQATIGEVADAIKQNTRHFAKRQIIWFNKVNGMNWFEQADAEKIIAYIKASITL